MTKSCSPPGILKNMCKNSVTERAGSSLSTGPVEISSASLRFESPPPSSRRGHTDGNQSREYDASGQPSSLGLCVSRKMLISHQTFKFLLRCSSSHLLFYSSPGEACLWSEGCQFESPEELVESPSALNIHNQPETDMFNHRIHLNSPPGSAASTGKQLKKQSSRGNESIFIWLERISKCVISHLHYFHVQNK